MDQIALISDVHGNMPALEAVLRDIRVRQIGKVFCLGDLVGKGPHSAEAVDNCREACETTVKGNWDDFILAETKNPVLQWHRIRLGKERLNYLAGLPGKIEFYLSGKRVRLFHASHKGVQHRVHMQAPRTEHLEMFTNTDFTGNTFEPDVVGYGDIHRAYVKSYQDQILFNTGSVGNPLDMTQASYIILEGEYGSRNAGVYAIRIVRVPYDIELAIRQAERENMPELAFYADELRSGRYRGSASSLV